MNSIEEHFIHVVRNGSRDELIDFIKKHQKKNKDVIVEAAINENYLIWHHRRVFDTTIEKAELLKQGKNNLFIRNEFVRIAILGCSSYAQYKKYDAGHLLFGDKLLRAVEDVNPEWINSWANHLLDRVPWCFWSIRGLVNAGFVTIDSQESYTAGFVAAGVRAELLPKNTPYSATAIADHWEQHPDIMNDLLWRVFEFEGGGDISLAAVTGSWTWTDVMLELAKRDPTRRDRLLDESLATLGRGFSQYRANWYSKFHVALCPTIEERQARVTTYMQLLNSNSANTVSFALKALKLLDAKVGLNPVILLEHIRPALQAKAKSNIKIAIRLIDRAISQNPSLIPQAMSIMIDGFIHEAKEIQELILSQLTKHEAALSDQHRSELQLYVDVIPASLLPRFEALAGTKQERTNHSELEHTVTESQELLPLAKFSDCIHQYLSLLENPDNPADVEMLLDGICRLSTAIKEEDLELLPALAKRANKIVKAANTADIDNDIDQVQVHLASLAEALVQVWESPTKKSAKSVELNRYCNRFTQVHTPDFSDIFYNRNSWVLDIVKLDKGLPLLSTPINNDYFVDGVVLLEKMARYKKSNIKLNETDLSIALMRLNPSDRKQVFSNVPKSKFNKQLMVDIATPPTQALFDLKSDLGAFSSTEPINGIHYENSTNYCVDYFRLTDKFGSYATDLGGRVNSIRWYSTIWPTNNEAFLSNALDTSIRYKLCQTHRTKPISRSCYVHRSNPRNVAV